MTARFGHRTEVTPQVSKWLNNDVPVRPISRVVSRGSTVSVVADATPHVKGAWVEVIASTSQDADLISFFTASGSNNLATQGLLDIGIGAAGAEQILIENIASGGYGTALLGGDGRLIFPIFIPSGSRISLRHQSVIASRSLSMNAAVHHSGFDSRTSIVTIGANTATSTGVALGPSNTYVEVTSSTSQEFRGIVMVPMFVGTGGLTGLATYTLGFGASGSEIDLGSADYNTSNTETFTNQIGSTTFVYWGKIPAGSRLAVKTSNAGSPNAGNVLLYGIPA